ncbi:MAG: ATP-binding cassette domain-containing protein [Acetobacterales bacterium]
MTVLRGAALTVAAGRRVILHDVDIELRPGCLTVLLGPNGAGKSTLVKTLAGLLTPSTGVVTLDEIPLAGMPRQRRARLIGYLPQQPCCAWALTVRQVAEIGRLPWDGRYMQNTGAVDGALAACELVGIADRHVSTLSGGEFMRAMLARVLAGEPACLLADEPTAGLDPLHQLRVMRLLRESASAGRAVLAVLHDLALADRFADEVVMLDGGRVAARGSGGDILTAETLRVVYGVEAVIGEIGGARVIQAIAPAGEAPKSTENLR